MTLKSVKFYTSETEEPDVFHVSFSGEDRYFHKLEVKVSRSFGTETCDYVELFGMWFFLVAIEAAGMHRTARNLSVSVSRGEVRRHLLGKSDSNTLGSHASALRAMLYGIDNIALEKKPTWLDGVGDVSICSRWDGEPCPYQLVKNERFGLLGITYHAIDRYFERTRSEGRKDQMLGKLQKLARAASEVVELPPEVEFKKILTHGYDQKHSKILAAPRGWMLVTAPDKERGYLRVISVYQRLPE